MKWVAIRRMVKKEHIDMICIQETKKEIIEKSMCQALWGDLEVSWEVQPASNTAGGILCIWSEKTFKLERKVIGSGFILLVGQWLKEAQQVQIISIYSPCDTQNKRTLWDNVKQLKNLNPGGLWCILGDFNNNIRNPSERLDACQRGGWGKATSRNSTNGLKRWRYMACHGWGENSYGSDQMDLLGASWTDS